MMNWQTKIKGLDGSHPNDNDNNDTTLTMHATNQQLLEQEIDANESMSTSTMMTTPDSISNEHAGGVGSF